MQSDLITRGFDFACSVLDEADAAEIWQAGLKIQAKAAREKFFSKVVQDLQGLIERRQHSELRYSLTYKWTPVPIKKFILDPYYLGKADEVYPNVMDELEEINSGKYVEIVLTGGIGSAKTTTAILTQAYQLYLMSCLHNPHEVYDQSREAEILLIFQSITKQLAKGVDFNRFKSLIENSRYFTENFPHNKDLTSELRFPNRIGVVPVSGAETAAIGQNVIGGIIDELNYMALVKKSKQSVDGGDYDQAVAVYNSISRRRTSRFLKKGKTPGLLCLVSSRRYPGQFTDKKEEEAKTNKTIYIYDKRVWEVKPANTFSGEWFHVFCGDETRKPRILRENEEVADVDRKLVMRIPIEFKNAFETDIINALREIAGVSTLARHPYFLNTEAVSSCFGRHASIFSAEMCDFTEYPLKLLAKNFVQPDLPRFVHIDLAVSGDSCGLAIGTATGFARMADLGFGGSEEMLPLIHVDGVLEIKPPRGGEILFYKVREIIVKLRDMGLNIRWISFDSFESKDSMQLLKQAGFTVGYVSVDTSNEPYDVLKSAVYTGRLKAPTHAVCRRELLSLERDTKTAKIDHPPNGSKDCSDGLAGMAHGITSRREIWSMYEVPVVTVRDSLLSVPESSTGTKATETATLSLDEKIKRGIPLTTEEIDTLGAL